MYKLGKFRKSENYYMNAAEEGESRKAGNAFLEAVYNDIGVVLTNLFDYGNAFTYFRKAYEQAKDIFVIKNIYFLSLTDPQIENKKIYLDFVGQYKDDAWDHEFETALSSVKASAAVDKLRKELDTDSVKRNRIIAAKITDLKNEFRNTF